MNRQIPINIHLRNFFLGLLFIFPIWVDAQCVAPPSNMTAWWPGDGHANDLAGNNHGTLINGAGHAAGVVNQAFSFDGVDDYISVPDHTSLRATGSLSIDFWANFDRVPRGQTFDNGMAIIEKANDYVVWWRPDLDNGVLALDLTDTGDGLYHIGAIVTIPTLQAGQWHHFAVTTTNSAGLSTEEVHFYLDGVELSGVNPWSFHSSLGWFQGATGEVRIGARALPNSPLIPFDGLIDEVEVFDQMLTLEEIQAIYQAGSNGKCKPRVSHTSFEVSKDFSDGNPAGVEVTIICNTGLPLKQSKIITRNAGVNFVVTNFADGQLDCSVTEAVPVGYTPSYLAGGDSQSVDDNPQSPGCHFFAVSQSNANQCTVTNTLERVFWNITKQWVFDENQQEIDQHAEIELFIENFRLNPSGPLESISGSLSIEGDWSTSFFVHPNYGIPATRVRAIEHFFGSGAESDQGCAEWIKIKVGDEPVSCTITNTAFFEGIPTLGRYSLALLTLLTLSLGVAGFRRLV